jgi:hypothetical protein
LRVRNAKLQRADRRSDHVAIDLDHGGK